MHKSSPVIVACLLLAGAASPAFAEYPEADSTGRRNTRLLNRF
jgi:hypothetical protein